MKILLKIILLIILISFNPLYGCSKKSNLICLEDSISIRNDCGGPISVLYFDYEDKYDFIDEILQINSCNVLDKEAHIEPLNEATIEVFLGRCSLDDESGLDNCQRYVSEEKITIQFGDKIRDFNIDKVAQLIITNSSFD